MWMFSRTSRISCAFPTQGVWRTWENYRLQIISLRVRHTSPYLVVRSADAATSKRHNAMVSSGLNKHVHTLLAAERKRSVCLSRGGKFFQQEFLVGARKSFFLGMCRFRFLTETSRETIIFAFYLFYFIFYGVVFLFLFNPHNLWFTDLKFIINTIKRFPWIACLYTDVLFMKSNSNDNH